MLTINLAGFKPLDAMSISVSQGALTAGPVNVAAWGQPNTGGTITIEVDRTTLQCAPDSVRFSVDLSAATFDTPAPTGGEIYDARLHDLIYLWDFDDAAGNWTAPVNVLAHWKNRNVAKGPWVAHMYTAPKPSSLGVGNGYKPSVLVIEPSSGKTATASIELFVEDPDDVYAGANTICISPTGSSSGAPAGATIVTSDQLVDGVTPRSLSLPSGPMRWLFQRGETFDMQCDLNLDAPGAYFGAYGAGAKPVVNALESGGSLQEGIVYCHGLYGQAIVPTAPDLRYTGLRFQGTFDATSEWSNQIGSYVNYGLIHQGNLDLMVSDCYFDGFHTASLHHSPGNKENPAHAHIDNAVFTNFGGQYPVYQAACTHPSASFSATGTSFAQVPDAIDNDATNSAGTRSPIRLTSCPRVHARGCEFYHTDHDHAGFRISGTVEADGYVTNVHSCSFELGFGAFTMFSNTFVLDRGIGRSTVQNVVIDGCIWVAGYCGETFIDCLATGLTVRNCLVIMPDVAWIPGTSNPMRSFFKFRDSTAQEAYDTTIVGDAPIRIYNNTLVCERSYATNNSRVPLVIEDVTFQPGFTNIVEENNILHMPNMTPATTTFAPLATNVLWTPRNIGQRNPDTLVLDTGAATPTDAVKSYSPATGSAALGAATTGAIAYDSIGALGTARPATKDAGAWQASV